MSSSDGHRLRQSLIEDLKARGYFHTTLASYAEATNLLERIDAELLATDTDGNPLTAQQRAERARVTAISAIRAEQTCDALTRDAAYDRDISHGPFSHLPPVRRASSGSPAADADVDDNDDQCARPGS
jgi:hypothetical protein